MARWPQHYHRRVTSSLSRRDLLALAGTRLVVDEFVARRADVAAGVGQQLVADVARIGGLRLLPGYFMVIEQAMDLPKERGDAASVALAAFVERAKASGFVAGALTRRGIGDALVAPVAG